MKIRTTYVYSPIPIRQFDWSAIDDDTYEPGRPIGTGATEQEAVADLLQQIEEASDKPSYSDTLERYQLDRNSGMED